MSPRRSLSSSSGQPRRSPLPSGLRTMRRAADMTQAQLAREVGVCQTTVCDWERGRAVPRVDIAIKVMEVLKAPSVESLFNTRRGVAAA